MPAGDGGGAAGARQGGAHHKRLGLRLLVTAVAGVLTLGLLVGGWFPWQREELSQPAPTHSPVAAAPVPRPHPSLCVPRRGLTVATGDDISAGSHRRDEFARWSARQRTPGTLLEISGSTDERRAQLAAAAQAGSCEYGVLVLDVAWVTEFAEHGYIRPLDLPRDRDFLPGPLQAGQVDGVQYGVPFAADAPLEFSRRQATSPGWLLQLADQEAGTINLLELIERGGGRVLDGDHVVLGQDQEATWTALTRWQTSPDRAPTLAESLTTNEDDAVAAFRQGRTQEGNQVSHMRNWPVAFHRLAGDPTMRSADGRLAFDVRAPATPGVLGGSVLAISAFATPERQRQGEQLIAHLTHPEVQQRLFACGGYAPVLESVYDDYAEGRGRACPAASPSGGSELVEISATELAQLAGQTHQSLVSAVARPQSAYYAQFSEAFRRCARGVLNGNVSESDFFDSAGMLREALGGRSVSDPPC